MKKPARKSISLLIIAVIILVCICIAGLVTYATIQKNQQDQPRQCTDIYGDGQAMGTHSEPILIGNTCDELNQPDS